MAESNRRAFSDQPFWISIWLILDAIVALASPLHWSVDRATAPRAMIVTFGLLFAFFGGIVVILQLSGIRDRTFGGLRGRRPLVRCPLSGDVVSQYWYPGAIFTPFGGMAASAGVISFYLISYSTLTVVLMYLMVRPVWIWGKAFDLRTQADLLALRFDSPDIRTIAAVMGIVMPARRGSVSA